jgi:hypothetical protein
MIDPHRLPSSVEAQCKDERSVGYGKNRIVFRAWPRDPNGKTIMPSPLRGKEAGNGLDLWGATLYDFYRVHRLPDMQSLSTISTGSRLAKWMRQAGELIARDELAWADKEEDPKEISPVDIAELIRCHDIRVTISIYNQFSSRKDVRKKAKKGESWPSHDVHTEAVETKDKEDSIPSVDDDGDDTERKHGEAAVPVANDRAEKDTDAGAQLDEAMQLDEPEETAPKISTDVDESTSKKPKYDSPFNPAYYPPPWPFIPCANDTPPPTLQQRLPLHLLPQKLHVHDPWNCLSIHRADHNDRMTPWLSKVDIIQTYSLSLTEESKEAALKAREQAKTTEDEAAKKESVMLILPANEKGPTEEPLIEVVLPPRPRKRTQVEEAHLYLSPRHMMGVGNHSVVYNVEWELPRDLFVEARLCQVCIEQDARKQIQELKDQGKWEALLRDLTEKSEELPENFPDVSSGAETSQVSGTKPIGRITIEDYHLPEETVSFISPEDRRLADRRDQDTAGNDAKPGVAPDGDPPAGTTSSDANMDVAEELGLKPKGNIQQEEAPDVDMMVDNNWDSKEASAQGCAPGENKGEGKDKLEKDNEDKEQSEEEGRKTYIIEPPRVVRVASYSGLAVRVHTTVPWQDPLHPEKKCTHGEPGSSHLVPRTATLGVVAKLSIQHDCHLSREAENYQSFPSHFFEHWNGYNVIPPLHDPVPIGALCPQFYGYYTPDGPLTDGMSRLRYLSPILLLEQCGREIDPETLSQDDKQECASLLFRFHHAGWLHESFAERNILWQQGKPTQWPIERFISPHKSFRLIDFGRSKEIDHSGQRAEEEDKALRLFHLLHHKG